MRTFRSVTLFTSLIAFTSLHAADAPKPNDKPKRTGAAGPRHAVLLSRSRDSCKMVRIRM